MTRSRFDRGRTMRVTYSDRMFVALVTHPAMRMRRIIQSGPKNMYTLFTHQYKGAVCMHFFGPLCILVFSL
jgi:hypothetical protein